MPASEDDRAPGALRPCGSAVRKAIARRLMTLAESHDIHIECASRCLLPAPIAAHGFERLVANAREATARLVQPSLKGTKGRENGGCFVPFADYSRP